MTVGYMNVNTLKRDIENEYYNANGDKIKNLANATIYTDADVYD